MNLNKAKITELTESNILKNFKGKSQATFIKGNLVYWKTDDKFYKVLDLKSDDDYKITFVSLIERDGDGKKEVSSEKDLDQFQNYIIACVCINKEGSPTVTLETQLKIYDKLETPLESAFEGAGFQLMGYKLFFDGEEVTKDTNVSQLKTIKQGSIFYASEGFGKPFKFNRFKSVYTSYGWSNSGNYPDGIAFVPTQSIKVWGFSTFAAREKPSYEIRYRVKINGDEVEEDTVTATGWEDEHYYRHRLKGVYDVSSGSKIDFTCWIAENLASKSNVETFYGEDGYSYDQVENEHMGLFKIESGSESNNGTSVYSGHFGEIFYYLG